MDLDKTHGDEINLTEFDILHLRAHRDFNALLIKELENWIKSMYLLPDEFEFQKKKILLKIKEQILQECGW
jgi:hypothetical protein